LRLVIKAKYTRRWKGKDGKWNYEYGATSKESKYKFDAQKLGWSVSDAKKQGVQISNKHPGKYITMHSVFGEVTFTVHNSLPSSPYAPGDFKYGYARNGKWKDWSEARKTAYKNISYMRD